MCCSVPLAVGGEVLTVVWILCLVMDLLVIPFAFLGSRSVAGSTLELVATAQSYPLGVSVARGICRAEGGAFIGDSSARTPGPAIVQGNHLQGRAGCQGYCGQSLDTSTTGRQHAVPRSCLQREHRMSEECERGAAPR